MVVCTCESVCAKMDFSESGPSTHLQIIKQQREKEWHSEEEGDLLAAMLALKGTLPAPEHCPFCFFTNTHDPRVNHGDRHMGRGSDILLNHSDFSNYVLGACKAQKQPVGWLSLLTQHTQTQSGIPNWNSVLGELNCKVSSLTG